MNTNELLPAIEKWQASSHPDLARQTPEELFKAGFVEQYKRLHDDLWSRIIRLHGTLSTLEQLNRFPFEHLYAPGRMEFWSLVGQNFFDSAILMLHGLVNDTGDDVHSLRSFRNDIVKSAWLSLEKCDLLKQTLRERKFDTIANSIAQRVDVIRDSWVAHRLVDKQTGGPKEPLIHVSLDELRCLFDSAQSLFGALTFGASYVTLAGDLMPGIVGGKPTRTCLDGVLDAVLRDSSFINQPERRAEWWPEQRKHMNAERLGAMNELRKRVGLPEA